MRQILLFTVLALLLAVPAGALADSDRDPFETTAETRNPYRYSQAVALLTIRGIVRTETDRRAIVALPDVPEPAVLKEGDEISIRYQDISHRFTVTRIDVRNIRFRAGSGVAYEVRIR